LVDSQIFNNQLCIDHPRSRWGKQIYLPACFSYQRGTGLDLLGFSVKREAKVLLINNEDDASELTSRIAAILTYYKIDEALLKRTFYAFRI